MISKNYLKGVRELQYKFEVWSSWPEIHKVKTIKGYANNEKEIEEKYYYWSRVYKYDTVLNIKL